MAVVFIVVIIVTISSAFISRDELSKSLLTEYAVPSKKPYIGGSAKIPQFLYIVLPKTFTACQRGSKNTLQ
jgi:hypothetical protein